MGGIPLGPALAGSLYALLVGSAALALWIQRAPGQAPDWLVAGAPWVFGLFALCFAAYRLSLVKARKYPAFKAFFQIGVSVLFFTLLLPREQTPYRPHDELGQLMLHSDPNVRALAAEVVGYRSDGAAHAADLVRRLKDPDGRVRAKAHQSLVRVNGQDLGAPEQPGAIEAWGARFR